MMFVRRDYGGERRWKTIEDQSGLIRHFVAEISNLAAQSESSERFEFKFTRETLENLSENELEL